jgi:hypothetical protein
MGVFFQIAGRRIGHAATRQTIPNGNTTHSRKIKGITTRRRVRAIRPRGPKDTSVRAERE